MLVVLAHGSGDHFDGAEMVLKTSIFVNLKGWTQDH